MAKKVIVKVEIPVIRILKDGKVIRGTVQVPLKVSKEKLSAMLFK